MTTATQPAPSPPPLAQKPSVSGAASVSKKKKKSKKVVPDNSNYASVEAIYPIEVKSSIGRGRHALAARRISEGTLVSAETATAFVVRTSCLYQFCQNCLRPSKVEDSVRQVVDPQTGKPVPGRTQQVQVAKITCRDCDMAAYCSDECKSAHNRLHSIQCQALREAEKICKANDADMDVVRLTLALLAKRHLDKADGVEASGPEGFEFGSKPSPYALFEDMPAHREQHDKGWITAIQSTFKELMKHLPEDARVSPGEATNIACRANSESHLFLDTFDRGYNEVIGVFPLSSMYFNHSCDPNCVYVGLPDGRLEIRTLYDVPKGAELSVSYVDLLQPREQRRRQLLLTRHFWCKCRRCSMPLSKSEDRFMDGILCRKCRRGVMIFEETKEVSDIDELMRDIEALNNEIQGKSAMCESCATEMPVTELVDVLKGAIEAYGSAFIALRERRNADAKAGFDEFLKKYDQKQVLHPYNSYLINAYIGLMQLGQMMDEPALSLTSGRQVVDRMSKSGALSPNSPELARYQAMLGRLYISVAKKKEEIPRQTPATKGLIRRYRIDGKGWIELAYNARYVALGQSHPLTVQLQQLSQTLLPRPPQAATPGPVAEAANSSGSNSADAAVAESSLEAAKKAKAKENKKPTIAQLQQTVKAAAAAAAAAANGNNEEKQQE